MADISQDLSTENLQNIKFLLSTTLTRETLVRSKVSQHSDVGVVNFWTRGRTCSCVVIPSHKGHILFMTEFPGRGHWTGEAGHGFVPEGWSGGGLFKEHRQMGPGQKSVCLQEFRLGQTSGFQSGVFSMHGKPTAPDHAWNNDAFNRKRKCVFYYPRKGSETCMKTPIPMYFYSACSIKNIENSFIK